ncbi:unnamed protein product [Meganyctiphanes norvegica]|uniref:UBZ4-type domain-containing protein n=1 Tax=Meganyctiphanes norvegica TaxID=48144 RepID=A0AAV2Q904_MEGNR
MLHHIAFSGSTPEHQSSPMITKPQQRTQQQQQQPQLNQQRNKETHQRSQQNAQNPQYRHQNAHVTQQKALKSAFNGNCSNKSKNLTDIEKYDRNIFSPEKLTVDRIKNPLDNIQDQKCYELMGARPKVVRENKVTTTVGNDSCTNKSIGGVLEDEYQAKHRARSILASAIPISPSSPTTPFAPMKSPSVPNMPKGYMPITSTILTPINFSPPCSSQRRQSIQPTVVSPILNSMSVLHNHNRSDSSPAVLETPPETTKVLSENTLQNCNVINADIEMNNFTSGSNTDQPGNNIVNSYIHQGSAVTNTIACSNESTNSEIRTCSPSLNIPLKVETETQDTSSNPNNIHESIATSVSNTNFTSITVTTTADGAFSNSTTSTYSSATSSRSSSPGFSLTTFALNSEGRGIPGTIFFAMGNDQKGCLSPPPRSPQPSVSPRCTSAASIKSPTPENLTAGQSNSPPNTRSPPSVSNVRIKSPTIQINSVKNPPIFTNSGHSPPEINNTSIRNHDSQQNHSSKTKIEEHWWSVEGPNAKATRHKCGSGKLVNSTWVRLMGGQAHSKSGSGLPWRTARAVPGHQLEQVRRSSQEEKEELHSNFNYSPAMTLSPSNSVFSSTCTSAATSPPLAPNIKFKSPEKDLKEMASKNIASAIISYELGAKTDANITSNTTTYTTTNPLPLPTTNIHNRGKSISNCNNENIPGELKKNISSSSNYMNDGIETLTRVDLVCPTCQMLFPPDQHLLFLDHFETCRGPKFVDM